MNMQLQGIVEQSMPADCCAGSIGKVPDSCTCLQVTETWFNCKQALPERALPCCSFYLKVYWHSELCRCICSYRYMTARVTIPSSVSPAGMAIPHCLLAALAMLSCMWTELAVQHVSVVVSGDYGAQSRGWHGCAMQQDTLMPAELRSSCL